MLEACGVPCIIAHGEAEALAVALCRAGLCDGVASNDLDCVCYGAPLFIRNLGNDEKREVIQIKYDDVLKQLNFSQEQFVDLCILLGCDYLETVKGVGPKSAFKLI